MPEGIIDRFEAVKIDQKQRCRLLLFKQAVHAIHESAAGQAARQAVLSRNQPQFQLRHYNLGETRQYGFVRNAVLARFGVENADRADVIAIGAGQRRTEIRADRGIPRHERVVHEAVVYGGILDRERSGGTDRMVAKGIFPGAFEDLQPRGCLHPLPVNIDQVDRSIFGFEDGLHQSDDLGKLDFGLRIEDLIPAKSCKSCRFVVQMEHMLYTYCPDSKTATRSAS